MIWLQAYLSVSMIVTLVFMQSEKVAGLFRATYAKVPGRVMAVILYVATLIFSVAVIPLAFGGAILGVVTHIRNRHR